MRVAIRADASIRIGTGHVMRCLTLADGLKESGAEVVFVCRDLEGNMIAQVTAAGFAVFTLPAPTAPYSNSAADPAHADWLEVPWEIDAEQTIQALSSHSPHTDWLIVDHYALDHRWQRSVRDRADAIMVIDDLADRKHECDLLLDQNYYDDLELRYRGLVPTECLQLLGPRFALLRKEFYAARRAMKQRSGVVRRLLVYLGGVDCTSVILKTLAALRALHRDDLVVDVVLGAAYPHRENIESRAAKMPGVTLHSHVDDMSAMMARADLAIGGGGSATWERCCLALPAIVIVVAKHQQAMIDAMASQGALINLGLSDEVTSGDIKAALDEVLASPDRVRNLSNAARAVMNVPDEQTTNAVLTSMAQVSNRKRCTAQ